MPFKNLADRRHHIPKQRHRVTNWAAYDAGLRGRGSLTIWFTEAAIAACQAKTYATSAVVVDRDGMTIVAMRADDASPHTMENARRKAYTAMTFKQPTAEYAKKLADPNSVAHQQVTLPNVIAIPGGQPVKSGNFVVGGIGVSGSPGVDDDCVNAGLDKVKDQLQ